MFAPDTVSTRLAPAPYDRGMWPFPNRRSEADRAAAIMEDAIRFAADRWRRFERDSGLAPNIHLRDRVAFFAPGFAEQLALRFPAFATAPNEVLLLIIAKGVETTDTMPRQRIEKALGIVLPP